MSRGRRLDTYMRRVKRRASIVRCLADAEKETLQAEKSALLQVVLLDTCSPMWTTILDMHVHEHASYVGPNAVYMQNMHAEYAL